MRRYTGELRRTALLAAVVVGAALAAACVMGEIPRTQTPPPIAMATPTAKAPPPSLVVPTAAPSPSPSVFAGLEVPAAAARVTLPLHVLAHVGAAGEVVTVELLWQDGTGFANEMKVLPLGAEGGVVVGSLDWIQPGHRPPRPVTQPATIQVRSASGEVLAQQRVVVLHPEDAETQVVTLYWLKGETLQTERRPVPRTADVAATALRELLWGPSPAAAPVYVTALPTPAEVAAYPGRQPDWGPRVRLLGVKVQDGVATANFSKELRAYGGGSLRVAQIRQQVTRTLLELPGVREVRIAIEGETTAVLEP